ncbi:hypothetical protein KNE206_37690 [Kitasatospora sp. NE20-6]|uniref:hypothetical protein n=1 Tax=Kitasatospora sp. NE20-6 TaxID=2859066 RepID=UPI0034DC07DE
MTTAPDRSGRDQLAATVDCMARAPATGVRGVRVDDSLVEATVALLDHLRQTHPGEPIARAARVVADRLQLCVPMTAVLAAKPDTDRTGPG